MAIKIKKPKWKWSGSLGRRIGKPTGRFWHHAAGDLDAAAIHRVHLNKGYRGIGYNYVVEFDGTIVQGRPYWAIGGHTLYHNTGIGICFCGNYDIRREMPKAQLRAGQRLYDYLKEKDPSLSDTLHRNASGNHTACPGRFFPWAEIKQGVPDKPAKPAKIKLTDKDITVPRMYKPHRAGWWNVQFRPWIERVREQGDGDRIRAGDADPLIIPVPEPRPKFWRELMLWKKKVRDQEEALIVTGEPLPEPLPAQEEEDADEVIAEELEQQESPPPEKLAAPKRSPFWWHFIEWFTRFKS